MQLNSLKTSGLLLAIVLAGCVRSVPVIDLAKVAPEKLQQAFEVEVYTIDRPDRPSPKAVLGPIQAFSCQRLSDDPPASKGDALSQLRLVALEKGANAIVDVTFDVRGTDAFGANCWQSVQASGLAVIIAK